MILPPLQEQVTEAMRSQLMVTEWRAAEVEHGSKMQLLGALSPVDSKQRGPGWHLMSHALRWHIPAPKPV